MSPIGGISCIPENVHFPSRNPYGEDTQFASKWAPKNYSMYHSRAATLEAPTMNLEMSTASVMSRTLASKTAPSWYLRRPDQRMSYLFGVWVAMTAPQKFVSGHSPPSTGI